MTKAIGATSGQRSQVCCWWAPASTAME